MFSVPSAGLTIESREHWQSGEANLKRGMDWLDQIYKANHNATEDALAAHKDFCTLNLSLHSSLRPSYTDDWKQHGFHERLLTDCTSLTTASWMVSILN